MMDLLLLIVVVVAAGSFTDDGAAESPVNSFRAGVGVSSACTASAFGSWQSPQFQNATKTF